MEGDIMSNLFGLPHIAQLHEIQSARLGRGQPGIGPEVEELIRRLTSGGVAGKTDDIRTAQAKRLWDISVGRGLHHSSFEGYLADIPEIPAELLKDDADYPLLVLIEPRMGLKRLCELARIEFSGDENTFVEYDKRYPEFTAPIWIRVQNGRKNRNRAVRDCRASFAENEIGLTALQGVCTYLQHPEAVTDMGRGEDGHTMDLFGTIHRDHGGRTVFLEVLKGRPKLLWCFDNNTVPKCGSASRRDRKAL
jgi:hypothetical protein